MRKTLLTNGPNFGVHYEILQIFLLVQFFHEKILIKENRSVISAETTLLHLFYKDSHYYIAVCNAQLRALILIARLLVAFRAAPKILLLMSDAEVDVTTRPQFYY